MTQYVTVHLTLKQAEAAFDALTLAYVRAANHMDLDKPHGTMKEQTAMFHLRGALIRAIDEGRENLAKRSAL